MPLTFLLWHHPLELSKYRHFVVTVKSENLFDLARRGNGRQRDFIPECFHMSGRGHGLLLHRFLFIVETLSRLSRVLLDTKKFTLNGAIKWHLFGHRLGQLES